MKIKLADKYVMRRFNSDAETGGDSGSSEGGDSATDESSDIDDDDNDGEDDDADDDGADQLGDPGKKALDRMKAKLKSERAKNAKLAQQLGAQTPSDQVIERLNARTIRAEVKAVAKGKLADPADAFRFLDLKQFEVSEDGEVDEGAITQAINKLILGRPYLGAQGERSTGSGEGGARVVDAPRQLTRADLDRMTPQQVMEARDKGQLTNLLTGK